MTTKWREIPREAVRLPPYSPLLCLYNEPGKRVSKCRGCLSPIPKATPRLVVHMLLPGGRVYPNGGRTSTARFFFHPECFSEAKNALGSGRCSDCDGDFAGKRHWLGGSGPQLCSDCVNTRRYRRCDICDCYFPTHRVSRVVEFGITHLGWMPDENMVMKPAYACDRCAANDGITTVKSKLRQERADSKFEDMYLSVLERIRDKGIFG